MPSTPLSRRLLCAWLIMPALARAALPSVAQAIRAVVEAQLDAFGHDDAVRAFSYAAPEIQRRYGHNAQYFLAVVQQAYPVVYRPKSVTFLKPRIDGGQATQPVLLTDTDDDGWIATYRLRQQPDKSWRILGCELQVTDGLRT